MQPKTIATIAICAITFLLLNSTIFLFTTPPHSYVLFVLISLLTAVMTFTVLGKIFIIRVNIKSNILWISISFVLLSIALIALQSAGSYFEILKALLYIVVPVLVLGISLLFLSKFKPSYSRLEYIALAFPLSFSFITILGTFTLFIPPYLRGISILFVILSLSILSVLVLRRENKIKSLENSLLSIGNQELILIIILLFLLYFYVQLYPQVARLIGLDVSRNFIIGISFTGAKLGEFFSIAGYYPLYGIYLSTIIDIVKPSFGLFQITTISLNILVVLSFYAMASQYLKKYGDHVPAVATLIWALFSGFGWFSFLSETISNPNMSSSWLIEVSDMLSYGDITWKRLLFYLSMESSFTLVFALFYFLKKDDLPKTRLILLMCLLLTPLPLLHPYALYLLFPILLGLTIFCFGELRKQLKCIAFSLIIASFSSLLINYLLYLLEPSNSIRFLPFIEYLLFGSFMILFISFKDRVPRNFHSVLKKTWIPPYLGSLIAMLLLLFYASFLSSWLSKDQVFDFSALTQFGYVPWFLYPVKIGIAGLLALIVVYTFIRRKESYFGDLKALMASVALLVLVSRILSTMQMQYVSQFELNSGSFISEIIRTNVINFREERMFEIIKVPLAMLASVALSKQVFGRIKSNQGNFSKYLMVSSLISLIVIFGISSTFLGFEYYDDLSKTRQISQQEFDIINDLREKVFLSGKSIIISPQTSSSYLEFTGATAIVTESLAAWKSKSPEFPLFVTRYSEGTPTYIYLNSNRDYQALSGYAGGYLEHLSNTTATYLQNEDVQIRILNNISTPSAQSTIALAIPYNSSTMRISRPFFQEVYRKNTILALFFDRNLESMNSFKNQSTSTMSR